MNKKLLSLALCVVMLASVLPLEAFAADIVTDPAPSAEAPAPVCTCETACAPAARNAACPVCSAADASEAVCAKYVAPVAPLSAPGGDEEASPSPTVTTTPEPTPTPAATPEPTPTPAATPEPTPAPASTPDADRAARIAAVQALIDALPTPDAFSALAEAELEAATAQVSAAVDAYDALSSDEQAEVNAEALFALFALPEDPAEELEGEAAKNFLVGENGYADINAAIDAVTDGGTIKVNADNLTFEIPSSVTKAFTLDLNGKALTNVTVSGGSITLTNASNVSTPTVTVSGGNVTITGSNTVEDFGARKFTVTRLVVSDGTVNFNSGIINSVDVSSGTLNINGGYIINNNSGNTTPGTTNGNGVLTLTGGTATLTGGSIEFVNLGTSSSSIGGTLNINTATKAAITNYIISELHYYGGTLNFGRNLNFTVAAAISALKVNNSGLKQNLSNGSFDAINIISDDLTHLDLLAPGYAFSDKDGNLVDASNSNNLTGSYSNPYLITSHTCKYDATTGKCACGRSSFVAVVEYDDTNTAYPYSTGASQADLAKTLNTAFAEAATHPDCTVKLMTDVAYNSEVSDEEYSISSGTFTLDLSGHSIGGRIRIKESADVTIKDSSTTSGTVSRLYISNNNPVCTVTGGTFNTIQCDSGTLNFQSGTVSGTNAQLYITGGTANITGGTIDKLETTNSAVLNVSNTTSTPTITTLTYQSGTVSLIGGEYTTVTTAGSTGLMCIDLCAENYAFFTKGTGESGDSIAYAANITLGGDESTVTYLVKPSTGHTCVYDKTVENSGKCTGCGRECPHTALNENSVCDACGVEFLAEVTYTEGESTKKEIFRDVQKAINKAAAKNGTVTLLANSEASELKFESGTYTLDLNGFTLSCLYGEAITVSGNYVTLVDNGNKTDNALIGDISISGSRTGCKLTVDGARVGNNNNPTSITVTQGELEVKPGSTVTGSVTVKSAGNTLTVSGGIFNGVNGSGEVKIDNGKATVSGGTFNVPFIVTGDNPNSTTLSGGTFSSLQVASEGDLKKMLAKGYVYYDNTDNPKPLSDITGTTLSNVTVKKCTHDNLTGTKCEYCGQTFAVKATYGDTTEYYTAENLENAYTAAGSQNRNGTVTLLTDVTQNSSLVNNNLKFTLDLSGHDLTFSSGSFNVFGDITLKDSTTGETKGKLNTNDINVTGKLTLSGAEIVISGTSKNLEVKDGGALTVNSGTIKGDVNVTGANSALTVSGGTFAKSDASNGFVSAGDGTKVIISGGTFSEDTTLQIYNSEVELSGGKFGTINATGTNTLPGILKANYEYKYYDGKDDGKWTNGESLTTKSIYRVEVKPIPIGSITITPSDDNPTYGESFILSVEVKDMNEEIVTVPDDGYKWYRDGKYVTIDNNKRDPAKFTPDEISRQAGERTYRYEATVDGYTKSQEITLTIKKAELTDEQKGKITPPKELTDITYSPVLSDGAYTGEGAQRDLFGVVTENGLPTDGEYQYSFDGGKTWSSEMGRSDAGTYNVLWRVNSPNYEIYTPTDNEITGKINPLPVSIASVTDIKDKIKPYDGTPDLPQQTTPPAVKVSYKYDVAGALIDKTFALRPADYALKLEYAKESGGNYSPDSAVGTDKPILATLTLKNSNFVFDDATKSATSNTVSNPQVAKDGQTNLTGTIAAATLTITAVNKTAYVGDPVPSLDNPVQGEDFIVTGLAKGDTLESLGIKVKLVYVDAAGDPVTPDMTKPDTYKINPEPLDLEGYSIQSTNYQSPAWEMGTLTIEEAPEYTITASAGLNGSISPSGAVKVKQHQSQTFVITPNTGYVVANVKVDGVNLGSIRTYTFNDVKDDGHTIEATFMRPWGNPQTGVDVG